MAQRNFGITIDPTSRTWSIILSSNLNTTSPYSISNQNNIDDLGGITWLRLKAGSFFIKMLTEF
jgi:hypothetical protein